MCSSAPCLLGVLCHSSRPNKTCVVSPNGSDLLHLDGSSTSRKRLWSPTESVCRQRRFQGSRIFDAFLNAFERVAAESDPRSRSRWSGASAGLKRTTAYGVTKRRPITGPFGPERRPRHGPRFALFVQRFATLWLGTRISECKPGALVWRKSAPGLAAWPGPCGASKLPGGGRPPAL